MRTGILAQQSGKENSINLVYNGNFEDWSAGASAAPDGFIVAGAGATVARESSIIKLGTYSAKLTRSGATAQLLVNDANYVHLTKGIEYWKGKKITLYAFVYGTVADRSQLFIWDGVNVVTSSFHSGGSVYELLKVTATIDVNATVISTGLQIITGDTSAYIDGIMVVEGESIFAFENKPISYSRGIFTPGVSFGNATTGITYTTQTGYYTKIGNVVHAWGYVQLSSNGSASGYMRITGLPFTCVNLGGTMNARFSKISYTGAIMGWVNTGNNFIGLEQLATAGTVSDVTDANTADDSSIIFDVIYMA